MTIGADPPTFQRSSGPAPSRPPTWRILVIALIAVAVGIGAGFGFHSVEVGITVGAAALSVLRDLWPSGRDGEHGGPEGNE